jgi:hypothetical protein
LQSGGYGQTSNKSDMAKTDKRKPDLETNPKERVKDQGGAMGNKLTLKNG